MQPVMVAGAKSRSRQGTAIIQALAHVVKHERSDLVFSSRATTSQNSWFSVMVTRSRVRKSKVNSRRLNKDTFFFLHRQSFSHLVWVLGKVQPLFCTPDAARWLTRHFLAEYRIKRALGSSLEESFHFN